MQTCVYILGILLAGQLSDSSGKRYAPVTPPVINNPVADNNAGPLSDVLPIERQPWADQFSEGRPEAAQPPAARPLPRSNPLRAAAPAAEVAPRRSLVKNTQLFRSLAKPVGGDKLSGTALSLAEAVENTHSRSEQTERVKTYWELSQAVTEFYLASVEAIELQSLRNNISQPSVAWQQAQQAVGDRKQVAREAVEVAQLRLQAELGRRGEARLPLPSDLPHCGDYETRYGQIFPGRGSSAAKQLSELLPLRHQELSQQARDTMKAHDLLTLVDQQRSPQSDGTQLLNIYQQLVLQRRVFVTTAYQYNSHIADYTQLAVPQDVGTVRLVSMLIQSEGNLAGGRSSIRRTSVEEPISQNGVSRGRSRTFAEDGWNETRRVPTDGGNGERSIMVPPTASQR